jgi:sugar-specific transcriptional regulator TrmB
MNLEEALKNTFKLSLYEAKAYLALLKGRMEPKEVSRISGVPLPRIYDILKSLEDKGFIQVSEGKYSALPPDVTLRGRILQFKAEFERDLAEREKVCKDLIKQLENIYSPESLPQEIAMLRGINTIANKFAEILKESEEIFIMVKKALEAKEVLKKYLGNLRGKKIRMLVPQRVQISEEDKAFALNLGIEIRVYDNPLFDFMVADGRDVIIGVPDPTSREVYHSIAIWIRNPAFARPLQESLKEIWGNSRPY